MCSLRVLFNYLQKASKIVCSRTLGLPTRLSSEVALSQPISASEETHLVVPMMATDVVALVKHKVLGFEVFCIHLPCYIHEHLLLSNHPKWG